MAAFKTEGHLFVDSSEYASANASTYSEMKRAADT